MDLDRIQPVEGLKVQRTGSEQERRRRRGKDGREFAKMLESDLTDDLASEDDVASEPATTRSGDTVSITSQKLAGDDVEPLVEDKVQLSAPQPGPSKADDPGEDAPVPEHSAERAAPINTVPDAENEDSKHIDTVA